MYFRKLSHNFVTIIIRFNKNRETNVFGIGFDIFVILFKIRFGFRHYL